MQTILFNRQQWVRKPIEHSIYTGTPLMPYIFASRVVHDAEETNVIRFSTTIRQETAIDLLHKLEQALVDRAEKCYQHSPGFRQQLNNPKTDCRKVLEMFMQHWLKSELKKLTKNL